VDKFIICLPNRPFGWANSDLALNFWGFPFQLTAVQGLSLSVFTHTWMAGTFYKKNKQETKNGSKQNANRLNRRDPKTVILYIHLSKVETTSETTTSRNCW